MKSYIPVRPKHLKGLAVLATSMVKNLVEFEIGPIPIEAMEGELYEILEEWIYEVESERELAYKLETGQCLLPQELRKEVVMPFGKYQGKRVYEVPNPYLKWLLEMNSTKLTDYPDLFDEIKRRVKV